MLRHPHKKKMSQGNTSLFQKTHILKAQYSLGSVLDGLRVATLYLIFDSDFKSR